MAATCIINIKQYVGLHISAICSNSFHKNKTNHCAHFISHILGFRFGYTCRHLTKKGEKSNAANIRVHEVFKRCGKVGTWTNKPTNLKFCLAFVTKSTNVNLKTKRMINVKRKHIGVFHGGKIYHYSNTKNKVVSQTPAAFEKHYSGSRISVFYGTMPI